MGIYKFVLAGIAVLPVLFAANGMAETSPAKNPASEKALTSPNSKEVVDVQAHSAPDHNPALTPLGAEKAGNADKTIPPWTGGITSLPKACYIVESS